MLDVFLDYFKKLFKSRLLPITLIYLALFCVVINRLFILQIVNGPTNIQANDLGNVEYRDIESTRGNIYDRTGKLLATNEVTYTVVMEDSTKIATNKQKNSIVNKLIKLIESNGNTLDTEFFIKKNKDNKLEFTIKGNELLRFKKKAYAFVLNKNKQLTKEQENATAQEVFEFLRSGKGYPQQGKMFDISNSYSVDDALKIMSVRYALFCNYPKYMKVTIASHVNNKTLTAIEENSDVLQGVTVEQQTHRVYNNGIYFSNIIGYTGLISSTELDQYNKGKAENDKNVYDLTDVVGKAGLESKYEEYLRGTKGVETVSVNAAKKVISVIDRTNPVAGNDVYLTIDSDLQIASYKLLERELANILLSNITPNMNYGSKGKSATNIKIPIYEVYNAFIKNNVIDVNHFTDKNATALEKNTYDKYKSELKSVFGKLDNYLSIDNKTTNNKAGDMQNFLDYFYIALKSNNLLITKNISSDDTVLNDFKNNKIPLSSFLKTALANNWIDLSKLDVGKKYYSTEELYGKLIDHMKKILKDDPKFKKMVYKNLIFTYKLSGREICLLLIDQGVLKCSKDEVQKLNAGIISPYSFVTGKLKSLKITPGMLALTPCSGSVVITDVKTGEVRALVSYPGYDNNKFSGKVDPEYFNKVNNDLATPMRNKPTFEKTAPGSTFKMVTSVAALQEGVTTPSYKVYDQGAFTKLSKSLPPKCDIYPSSHGDVNLMDALKVSCNYYFFEMGWRLGNGNTGNYNSDLGLSKLKKYASMFGLNKTSGIELSEAPPHISDTDAVRSAIGQGSNVFTPSQLSRYVTTVANSGTCYDLTLLGKIVGQNNKVIKDNKAKIDHKLSSVQKATWDAVHEGMYDVVNKDKGTVTQIFKNFGVTVAGKTGTSQISKSIPNNALFVSYAPYENPEISVTVVIPNGYTSHNAAQLAKDIYSVYFGKTKADSLTKNVTGKSSNNSVLD